MTFIGITGLKKSGKTTFAMFLQNALLPQPAETVSFADALKEEVSAAAGVTTTYLEEHKDSFRLILQGWGTDFRRNLCHKDYWTSRLLQKAVVLKRKGCQYLIIPDVRFHNEADVIKNVGGRIIRVTRDSADTIDAHASEKEQLEIMVDYSIHNSGGLTELKQQAEQLAARLKLI
jgi:hypothetical protein